MSRRRIPFFEYNAFTGEPFGGNPAGVVLDAGGLDDSQMQSIARQLNLAETAFLVPSTRDDADIRLRWFTPAQEVTLCGHATIAAFTAAADRGIHAAGPDGLTLRVETLSGVLAIGIREHRGRPEVSMEIPIPDFRLLEVDRDDFASLWGVPIDVLAGRWWVHAGLDYWYVPVLNRQGLASLQLNAEGLRRFDDRAAFTFYCSDTVESDSDWHLRFFAPFHGVPEDIVTGSAQGPMGVLHQIVTGDEREGRSEYKGEQGDILGRPGRVRVEVARSGGEVDDLRIAGSAVPMVEGKIAI